MRETLQEQARRCWPYRYVLSWKASRFTFENILLYGDPLVEEKRFEGLTYAQG